MRRYLQASPPITGRRSGSRRELTEPDPHEVLQPLEERAASPRQGDPEAERDSGIGWLDALAHQITACGLEARLDGARNAASAVLDSGRELSTRRQAGTTLMNEIAALSWCFRGRCDGPDVSRVEPWPCPPSTTGADEHAAAARLPEALTPSRAQPNSPHRLGMR